MTNERFFRMLSVAVLGLLALAAVPDSLATTTNAQDQAAEPVAPVEVIAVQEVEDMNFGHFDPIQAALAAADAKPIVIASPVRTTTVSSVDPNL